MTASMTCPRPGSNAVPPTMPNGSRRFRGFDVDDLSFDQTIDRALVMARLERRGAVAGWEEWRRSPEGYLETGITELFLLAMRSEDELTEAAVARLHGIGAVLDEARRILTPPWPAG